MLPPTPLNHLTEIVIGRAIEIHDTLGSGLLESLYRRCLAALLVEADLLVDAERPVPIRFKELVVPCELPLDLLVEGQIVVEVKACATSQLLVPSVPPFFPPIFLVLTPPAVTPVPRR